MNYSKFEINKGINLHFIKTDLFKTNLACVLFTVPLIKEEVTLNALIPFLLKRGTNSLKTQYEINEKLEYLYGSAFNCGVDKSGDNQIIKFSIEGISDSYINDTESLLEKDLELLFEIVFNPLLENRKFKQDFLEMEKKNLENIINSKIDKKDEYAFNACVEKMYGNQGFGLYKYGNINDIKNITLEKITDTYFNLIYNSKIDIFISGNFEIDEIKNFVYQNENIKSLKERNAYYVSNNMLSEKKEKTNNISEYIEKMNISQGKLVIGLDLFYEEDDFKYVGLIYNSIMGENPKSKLFQNVREKAGLCYTIRSFFVRQKKNIFINCGIEIPNYQKAIDLIKNEIDCMKNGDFDDNDIEIAKYTIISGIKSIETEQNSGIVYYIGQELLGTNESLEEYIEKIKKVSREQILDFANKIEINTIYFLANRRI